MAQNKRQKAIAAAVEPGKTYPIDQALKISGVVMVEQRNAKGFFRAKIVIERAFRHFRCFQQFAQPHTGKPPMHAELLAGGEDMFAGVTFTVLVHGAHCNRPIGLMQVIIKNAAWRRG